VEEQDLVRGLRARNEEAVRAYLERYRALFQHCISHFEADAALREDFFQELAWHALERLEHDSFDAERGSFGTWLYRVAWCRCVDLKRQENARRKVRVALQGDELPERSDPGAGPSDAAGTTEIGHLVRAALGTLEPEEQSLLRLRFVEGLALADIAVRLSITVEQAKYRLKRASSELRRALLSRLERATIAD
jgi:RNA polymerase sigma-70 factor (ECF subfamily)